ncbi:MAG: hypothetical protein GVY26_12770 [Bacteroidetes bacterium]|jgi:hypothetical protein|nr:hypothetical protein [Bacteroidota bacterium]
MSKTATLQELDRIDQVLQAHLNRWGEYTDEQLNERPPDGGWSPLQVMHHLILAEGGSLGYVKKKLSFQPRLSKLGFGDRFRAFMLNFYLVLPFKFKAPKGVGDEALPERSTFEETQGEWLQVRAELRAYLEGLPEGHFSKSLYKHPFAGRMSLKGMLQFFGSHVERHAAQIDRSLKPANRASA